MSLVIRVQNLSKCYHVYDRPQDRLKQSLWRGRKQFFREFWALRDVSFEVKKGEAVFIRAVLTHAEYDRGDWKRRK